MKNLLKSIIISVLTWEARLVLRRHRPQVAAITGSLGKTGTKDAVAAALSAGYSVRSSPKSFNSEFGVPLTILGLPNAWNSPLLWLKTIIQGFFIATLGRRYEDMLVLEVGADKPGDIASLAKWLKADVVIVTAVPEVPVHVEFYPTAQDVLKEKAALIKALKHGRVLITGDDELVSSLENPNGETLRVHKPDSAVMYEAGLPTGIQATIGHGSAQQTVNLQGVLGEHQALPAAFALEVAKVFDVELLSAVQHIESMPKTPGRMRLLQGKEGSVIIDDSYNSSPTALFAALETLGALELEGRKIAVLGDMRELGEHTDKEHRRAGMQAAHIVSELYTVGPEAAKLAAAAIGEGLPEAKVHIYDTAEAVEVGQALAAELQAGDVVLVKSSQGKLRLEKAVKELMQNPEQASKLLVRQESEWLRR